MKRISIFVILLWASHANYLYDNLSTEFPLVSIISIALLATLVSIIYFVVGGMISEYWSKTSSGKLLQFVFGLFLVPFASTYWIVGFDFTRITEASAMMGYFAVLLLGSYTLPTCKSKLKKWKAANDDFQKFLLHYPIRGFADLIIPMLFYFIFIIIPYAFPDAVFFHTSNN